jgi:hypothetical protein
MDQNAFVGQCYATDKSVIEVCWKISIALIIMELEMG